MKKMLTYALALALALSLTACGQSKTEQPTDPAPSTSAPETIATPEPIKDTAPEPVENTTSKPEPEQTPAAPVETEDTQPPEETESEEVESQVEEVQLFTDCNETVYATGTVNLRTGAGTSFEKVGSLNKGDSVTRTGIAIAGTEAEGWSRIQLSDGSMVYVSSNYISTTKPVVQQQQQQQQTSKPSGGTTTQQQQPSDTKQSVEQQAPTINKDEWDQAFYETLTPEQQEVYKNMTDGSSRYNMQQSIEKQRKREAEGWTTQFGDPTEEQLENAWSNIKVGQ